MAVGKSGHGCILPCVCYASAADFSGDGLFKWVMICMLVEASDKHPKLCCRSERTRVLGWVVGLFLLIYCGFLLYSQD